MNTGFARKKVTWGEMQRFLSFFGAAGFLLPFALAGTWALLEKRPALYAGPVGDALFSFQLLIWPTSVFLLGRSDIGALIASALLNIGVYLLIGHLIWLGMTRRRWIIYASVAGVLAIWVRLLTL